MVVRDKGRERRLIRPMSARAMLRVLKAAQAPPDILRRMACDIRMRRFCWRRVSVLSMCKNSSATRRLNSQCRPMDAG